MATATLDNRTETKSFQAPLPEDSARYDLRRQFKENLDDAFRPKIPGPALNNNDNADPANLISERESPDENLKISQGLSPSKGAGTIFEHEWKSHAEQEGAEQKKEETSARFLKELMNQTIKIGNLSFSYSSVVDHLSTSLQLDQSMHNIASTMVEVSPDKILRHADGAPISIAEKREMEAIDKACTALKVDEEIEIVNGRYYDKKILTDMNNDAQNAQNKQSVMNQLANGSLALADLPPDMQRVVLLQERGREYDKEFARLRTEYNVSEEEWKNGALIGNKKETGTQILTRLTQWEEQWNAEHDLSQAPVAVTPTSQPVIALGNLRM